MAFSNKIFCILIRTVVSKYIFPLFKPEVFIFYAVHHFPSVLLWLVKKFFGQFFVQKSLFFHLEKCLKFMMEMVAVLAENLFSFCRKLAMFWFNLLKTICLPAGRMKYSQTLLENNIFLESKYDLIILKYMQVYKSQNKSFFGGWIFLIPFWDKHTFITFFSPHFSHSVNNSIILPWFGKWPTISKSSYINPTWERLFSCQKKPMIISNRAFTYRTATFL